MYSKCVVVQVSAVSGCLKGCGGGGRRGCIDVFFGVIEVVNESYVKMGRRGEPKELFWVRIGYGKAR